MLNRVLPTVTVALAALNLVSAQTYTDCNPLKKTCPADPALGKEKVSCKLTDGECSAFNLNPGTEIKYEDKGAVFTIEKETQAPTIASKKFIFFGRLDVELQTAPGQGIVTAIVLQSADLDEIDWEWLGGDAQKVQTNYFSKGDTTTYDRVGHHDVSDASSSFHKYSIEWTKDAVNWSIDDKVIRTLKASDVSGYPQSPMQIKLGTWCAGGSTTAKGTVDWAGGYTDFSKAPFNAYYKSVSIVDYAGGDSATSKSVKEYLYGDNSGSWQSIQVKLGDSSDNEETTTTKGSESKTSAVSSSKTGSSDNKDNSNKAEEKTTLVATASGTGSANSTATPVKTPGATGTGGFSQSSSTSKSSAARTVATGGLIGAAALLMHLLI